MQTTLTKSSKKKSKKTAAPKITTPVGAKYQDSILVPLSLLVLSPDNVGKTGRDDVDELAALIASQGLLQPLLVKAQVIEGEMTGSYEVVAGGRRWRALGLLAKQKRIDKDELVECKQVTAEAAIEASIAENSGRMAMHPADEFEAFKRLIDEEGKTAEEVATRFGVNVLTVRRRLRLANVSPVLIAKYRAGAESMTLDQMMALAVTDDHQLQEAVWENAQHWERQPHNLRRKLTENELDAERHPLAKFVGLEAYEKAGGYVRRDLFSQDGNAGFIADVPLLRKLADERLQIIIDQVKVENWQWVEPRECFNFSDKAIFGKMPTEPREPTKGEAIELAALEKRITELNAKLEIFSNEENWGDEYDEAQEALEAAEARTEQINDGLKFWTEEAKAHSGAIITINSYGEAEIHRGLVKPEARADAAKAVGAFVESGAAGETKKERAEFSEKLMFKLTSHRTAAMQATMMNNHRIALVALTHTLALSTFATYSTDVVKVRGTESRYLISGKAEDMEQSRAWREIAAKRAELESRLPDDKNEYFGWLMARADDELLEILAFCTAATIDATTGSAGQTPAPALFAALNIDMADWWTPTADSYLGNVPKSKVIEAVSEAAGGAAAHGLDKMKKAELLASAQSKLESTRWLPAPLRA